MLTLLFLHLFLYSNPHCELRCQEQVNQKLVSSCVSAYKNYVDRHFMTPEQAIQKLKSSTVMNQRCTVVGTKIYANQERLKGDSTRCIINECDKREVIKKNNDNDLLFKIKPAESIQNKVYQTKNSNKKNIPPKTVKIKFHPASCNTDPSCITRDLSRCQEHNQTPNAESFNCKAHYSNLQIFTPIKNTISFLNSEGGLSGLNNTIKQSMQSCDSSHSTAELCCGDSMSCGMGGESGKSGQYLQTITNMTQIINSAGGLPEKCNALKNISRAGTAGVMAFSTNCYTAVDKCHNSCKPYMTVVQNIEDQKSKADCSLKNDFSSSELEYLFGSSSKSYKEFCGDQLKLADHKDSYRSFFAQCTGFKSEATKANADTGGLQAINEWAQKCEDYSKNNNQFSTAQEAFNNDCTNPAHYSNPICVQCRIDPSAQACAGVKLNNNQAKSNNINNNAIVEDSSSRDDLMSLSSFGTMGALDDNPGLSQVSALDPNSNKGLATAGSGGGGGGLGQDNVQALGTDPSQAGGSGGGAGYDTNVLGAPAGGGGYSSPMGYGSGGGYSQRITTDIYDNTPPTGIIKDGFDLKEYLPGGKAYKKKSRLPAGYIQLSNGEVIGPKHGNIFHMMHERYAYYESLGKFWPAHYSKEKIECIKKSGILNKPPHSNQWEGGNLHKATPVPNPMQCRHFANHDPSRPDPTQIYLKAQAKKERLSRTPQSVVTEYKLKSLNEIYLVLTKRKKDFTGGQYSALYKLYKQKYSEYKNKAK